MLTRRIILAAAVPVLFAASCGASAETVADTVAEHPEAREWSGIVQVLAQGSRSETVVLEETLTGEWYSLVGDRAREMTGMYGTTVTITAVTTDEGWTVRPEFPRLLVLDYLETSDAGGEDTRDY